MAEIINEFNQKYLKDKNALFYKNIIEICRTFTYYIIISFKSLRNFQLHYDYIGYNNQYKISLLNLWMQYLLLSFGEQNCKSYFTGILQMSEFQEMIV